MAYLNKTLAFNAAAKGPSANVHHVVYESSSVLTESWEGGKPHNRYFLLGAEKKTGEKVVFCVAKTVLNALETRNTYAFTLSDNYRSEAFNELHPDQDTRTYGVCKAMPQMKR